MDRPCSGSPTGVSHVVSESETLRRSTTAELATAAAASAGMGGLAGFIAGFVWGGIGGRVAMRVLFLTSSDSVRGVTSDDGFEIGRISGDTIFLVISMSFLGAILGAAYGLFRVLIQGPIWMVSAGMAAALGAGAGGGLIVSADGIDFRFLDPLWLAIGLFIFLPAAWAATVVLATERLLHSTSFFRVALPGVDARPFGTLGSLIAWASLAVATTLGIIDLLDDIDQLT